MTDSTLLEQAQKICRNLLDLDLPETPEKIRSAIEKVIMILPGAEVAREQLYERLLTVTGVSQEAPRILDNDKLQPWVIDKWAENPENRKFWSRYKNYLTDEKKFAPKIISRLDELTNNILDRLADPDSHDQYDKRGLVVGHVQSGKTSNYIGLITKAADAGYKLIVVMAGIHNSLRSQTQLRIDEGFLGYDTETSRIYSSSTNRMGVGRFDPSVAANSLTSSASNGDFKKSVADSVSLSLSGNANPVVVVIKKNNSVLKNLINWLSQKFGRDDEAGNRIVFDLPLLLIDDEADNASINISKDSVSAINGSIRAMLTLFRKSAYVGYTATPYANVFIPPPEDDSEKPKGLKIVAVHQEYPVGEDLFPRNFIINIPPPSNYIGPEKVFGIQREDKMYEEATEVETDEERASDPIHLYKLVKDYQPGDYFDSKEVTENIRLENSHFIPDRHRKDDTKPDDLPESLKTAIKHFILACAARRVRGQINVHNSMLIHVTRFVDWQNHIAGLVGEELSKYKNRIEFNQPTFLEDLQDIWLKEFELKTQEIINHPGIKDPDIKPVSWSEVKLHLLPAIMKIQLRAVHGSKLLGGLEPENIQALDYYDYQKKGLSVIAVGGNKLSRGLTLEGLTVSYYLRSSKMYDTLMQMGRWFGYRPGYLDLCRLFTSGELVSHYKHIAAATEEMRAEFDRMYLQRKTPREFGLKVRAHTGVLTITASNKFRYKKMMSFSFSGDLKETWQFDRLRKDLFKDNYQTAQTFLEKLGSPTGPSNDSSHLQSQKFVWSLKNNYQEIIRFLREYQSAQKSFPTGLLADYIKLQANNVKNPKLTDWTVAIIENTKARDENRIQYFNQETIGMSFRRDSSEPGSGTYDLVKAHIIGNFHEYIDLSDEQLEKALNETAEDRKKTGGNPDTVIHPNPLRIRTNRPETNGLLLIYLLNPVPNDRNERYSDVPIVGLALSFPHVQNESKVVYAVNDVFQKELFDYPDELDNEDFADESKAPSMVRNTMAKTTFMSLLENEGSQNIKLDKTEFSRGVSAEYALPNEKGYDWPEMLDMLVSSSVKVDKDEGIKPYYSEKEIQQYYLNPVSESRIINATQPDFMRGECVVGLEKSKYVMFSYHQGEAVFSNKCWVIQSGGRLNLKYLTAVYNSTLFGAWVRVTGEQKKDSYHIDSDVLENFPLTLPEHEDIQLFENLYDLLVAAARIEEKVGTGTMKSYYSNILDALVFCCYFGKSLESQMETLRTELSRLTPQVLPEGDALSELAREIFEKLYHKKHPVREVLFYLGNQSKVSRIKAVFTS